MLTQIRSFLNPHALLDLFNKDLKLLFFANLIGSFGDGLYAYIMPYYMKGSLGASPVEVGILYATTNGFAASTLLAAGFFGDRSDRKKILILGWFAWVPAPLIFAFAQNWVQMLPGMVLWGVFLGPPVSAAYIITSVKPEKITITLAAVSSSFSLGYIFSPALGGYLAGTVGMKLVFFMAFIFYSFATIVLLFIRSQFPSRNKDATGVISNSRNMLLRNPKLLFFSGFFALVMFTMYLFRPFIPTFLADAYGYNGLEIGVLGSFSFFGSAVLAIILGRVGDKFKKLHAMVIALVLVAFSLTTLLFTGNFWVLLIVHFFIGASYLSWPLMSAIIGSEAPSAARAFSVAIPLTAGMFASAFAPYAGGILYEASAYYPFVLAIVVSALLTLFGLIRTR